MKPLLYISLFIIAVSCTGRPTIGTENDRKGKLKATHQLVASGEKRILIDTETASKPPYIQMIKEDGKDILTLLNPHKNAIYFYDYATGVFDRRIVYEKEGPHAVQRLGGYYIKNMDSIYVYNRSLVEIILTDSAGHVKQRDFLHDNSADYAWALYYPQYELTAMNPIIETNGKLVMPGMFPFHTPDSLIDRLRFTTCIDLRSSDIQFINTYPRELYGNDVQWYDSKFTQPFTELTPNGKTVYSFPVSHNLYIGQLGTEEYKVIYGGSNVAKTIKSVDYEGRSVPREILYPHVLQQDLYAGIRHDPYRHVYYRFMMQGIPDATMDTPFRSKPIIVIIMDEQFKYLGETVLGTEEDWNWNNTFVTSEGLMIEYLDKEADPEDECLLLKAFTVEKI